MSINGLKLVNGVQQIASPTMVYQKLLAVVNDPSRSMKDFAGILGEDPGLTARLLKIVNSAYYGFPGKIDTISRAITVVGTHQLCELVLATSVLQAFRNIPDDLVNMESFWRHSLACALICRSIAKIRQETNVERFFVAGLLHDIGRLVIYMKIPEEGGQSIAHARENDCLLYFSEQKTLGINHAAVGQMLAEAWNLPQNLQAAIGYHHMPWQSKCFPVEAATVHVADIIANTLQFGSSGERFVPPLYPLAWETLAISSDCVPLIVRDVEEVYEETVELLLKNSEN